MFRDPLQPRAVLRSAGLAEYARIPATVFEEVFIPDPEDGEEARRYDQDWPPDKNGNVVFH
jgi:hypothetical protein